MDIRLIIKVYGRVQGVGYRNFAFNLALELGVKGFVENRPDKSVYIEIETTQMKADQYLEWCYKGSPLAKVSKIEVEPIALFGYKSFEVRK